MAYVANVPGPSVERKKISNIKRRNMKVDVLLGLQWGDEGKGKVVDVLKEKVLILFTSLIRAITTIMQAGAWLTKFYIF